MAPQFNLPLMAPPNLTSLSPTPQILNTLDVESHSNNNTSFDVTNQNTVENTPNTFTHMSSHLKTLEPITSTVKTSHQPCSFNTTASPIEITHCFPFSLFSILLHSFSPHSSLSLRVSGINCLEPYLAMRNKWKQKMYPEYENLGNLNRFSYLVEKSFRPSYSPGISAMSSKNNGRRVFGAIATSVANNLSPELGADDNLSEKMELIVAGSDSQTNKGQQTPTAQLSDPKRSDYDPSKEVSEKSKRSEGWQIGEIDILGQIRESRFTFDTSKRDPRGESKEDSAGDRNLTCSSVRSPSSLASVNVGSVNRVQASSPRVPPGLENRVVYGPHLPPWPGRGRGRGRGPRRVYSNVPKGPGPEWILRPARGGLILIPSADPSPPQSPTVADSLESGEFRPNLGGDELPVRSSSEMGSSQEGQPPLIAVNGAGEAETERRPKENRQASPSSGQLMPKRQRLEEF